MICLGRRQLRLFSGTQSEPRRILVRLRVILRHESEVCGSDGGVQSSWKMPMKLVKAQSEKSVGQAASLADELEPNKWQGREEQRKFTRSARLMYKYE